ncbi:MAG: sulfotransferase family protein [bacterium]
MKKNNYILITGMVRSGTTLLSRAIDAHPEISTPPDPYFAFFRAFRNEIYKNYVSDFDDDKALSDNLFNINLEPKREISNSTLDREISNQDIEKIKSNIIDFTEPNSPLIIPYIKDIKADTYKELYIKMMEIINEAYGDEKNNWTGFKQTWVEEFVTPLLKTFPEMKVVQIIRDPRAIIASRTKTTHLSHNYPLYFMLKHWRKSFAYALYNSYHYPDNFKLIKYEDLTKEPKKTMKNLSNFIGVDYNSRMSNPQYYRDGKGNSWTDNSAYSSTNKITAKYLDKWKNILSDKEIQYIEDLCLLEMEKLSYHIKTEPKINESVFYDINFDDDLDTTWIKEQASREEKSIDRIKNELLRNYVYNDQNPQSKYNEDFLEMLYLIPNFLVNIKKLDF